MIGILGVAFAKGHPDASRATVMIGGVVQSKIKGQGGFLPEVQDGSVIRSGGRHAIGLAKQ